MRRDISYTGLYLDHKSRVVLKRVTAKYLKYFNVKATKSEVERYCHHMTISLGPLVASKYSNKLELGEAYALTIWDVSYDKELGVMAFRVGTKVPSMNKNKHITVYVKDGSKPFYSNKLDDWKRIPSLTLRGTIEEFRAGDNNPVVYDSEVLESVLYGEDLSLIKNSVILLYSKKEMRTLAYGYDLLSVLIEASFIRKNTKSVDMSIITKDMNKHNIGMMIVEHKFFTDIKNNNFYLRGNIGRK